MYGYVYILTIIIEEINTFRGCWGTQEELEERAVEMT